MPHAAQHSRNVIWNEDRKAAFQEMYCFGRAANRTMKSLKTAWRLTFLGVRFARKLYLFLQILTFASSAL